MRDVTGGTVAFGTFGSAHHYLLGGLIEEFRRRHPSVRVRVVGQNSAEVADAVRDGHLEAGLVVLPVDDRGLDVRPAMQEELLYLSAEPRRVREPMTIEKLADAPLILYDARWGADDPMRRQLRERAQRAGVKLEPDDRGRVHDRGARPRRSAASATRSPTARSSPPAGSARRLSGRAVRPAAVRDVRLHHAPQRAPVAGHAGVHRRWRRSASRRCGGGSRRSATPRRVAVEGA